MAVATARPGTAPAVRTVRTPFGWLNAADGTAHMMLPFPPPPHGTLPRPLFIALLMLGLTMSACSTSPKTQADRDAMVIKATATIRTFKAKDPGLRQFFDTAHGYAVFPTVGKGGFFVGGAFGRGQVYVGSAVTGDTSLSQISFGFQLGGEAFSEIIFFETRAAYDNFASGKLHFSAQAQAVAIVAGAQAQTGTTGTSSGAGVPGSSKQFRGIYNNGMAVFTYIKGGLMYEASVAGQRFTFEPK